jgi:hypothetical protein
MAVSRHWENKVRKFLRHPVVRELVSRYAKENPEAVGNAFELVMHALIAPLCRGPEGQQAGWSERDSWAVFEQFLMVGDAHKDGAHLSPAECRLLLDVLSGERELPARRRGPNTKRDSEMADFLELLEADGERSNKRRVARSMEAYGVSRSTVYTAKRTRKEESALFEPQPEPKGRNMTAEVRRNWIEFLEREAARKWRPRRP